MNNLQRLEEIESIIAEKMHQHGQPRNIFLNYDSHFNGSITSSDFVHAMKEFEISLTPSELSYIMNKYDRKNDGTIHYDGFLKLYDHMSMKKPLTENQVSYSAALLHPVADDHNNNNDNSYHEAQKKTLWIRNLALLIQSKIQLKSHSIGDFFLQLDATKCGYLTPAEFHHGIASRLGIHVELEDIEELFLFFGISNQKMYLHQYAKFLEEDMDSHRRKADANPLHEDSFYNSIYQDGKDERKFRKKEEVKDQSTQTYDSYISDVNDLTRVEENYPKEDVLKVCHILIKEMEDSGKKMPQIFHQLDVDGDKVISSDDLRSGLKHLGMILSRKECQRIISYFDEAGDGKIEYHEFVKMMQNLCTRM